jgi:hypothetical protein
MDPNRNLKQPHRMKNFLFALAVVAAGVWLGTGEAFAQTTMVVNAGGAVLRKGSSNRGEIVRPLVKGEKVLKLSEERGFFKVKTITDQQEGYISRALLIEVEETKVEVPNFDDFLANLEKEEAKKQTPRPAQYYFEHIFEYLNNQGQPRLPLIMSLFMAVFLLAGGGYLVFRLYGVLERVLPEGLTRGRRRAAKITLIVVCAYPVLRSTGYFLDLAMHFTSLAGGLSFLKFLAVVRVVLAGPVTVVDAFGANWFIGAVALFVLGLIVWPGFKPTAVGGSGEGDMSVSSGPPMTSPRAGSTAARSKPKTEAVPAPPPATLSSDVIFGGSGPSEVKETRIVAGNGQEEKKS